MCAFLETDKILEQEEFWENSTDRSLYRMQLEMEEVLKSKKNRITKELLNIDLEKAYDSVLIEGFLSKLQMAQ